MSKYFPAFLLFACFAFSVWFYKITFGLGLEAMTSWAGFADSAIFYVITAFIMTFTVSLIVEFDLLNRLILLFTLLGLIVVIILLFAVVYSSGGIVFSGSSDIQQGALSPNDFLYYSVVTFTTLGYGDFQPDQNQRIVAALQAFLGFLFMPIVIAELFTISEKVRSES